MNKESMDHLRVKPGKRVQLKDIDPASKEGGSGKKAAKKRVAELQKRMDELQFQLYAEGKRSLLICLQALDAGGKDGVVRHVLASALACYSWCGERDHHRDAHVGGQTAL